MTEQGDKLICLILSQMNNNRLSTTSNQPVDRTLLLDEINQLLSGPSNFELKNERRRVISLNKYYHSSRNNICVTIQDENDNNIHSFNSILECAKFLDVHPTTITKRIKKSISFLLKHKRVYIKRRKLIIKNFFFINSTLLYVFFILVFHHKVKDYISFVPACFPEATLVYWWTIIR